MKEYINSVNRIIKTEELKDIKLKPRETQISVTKVWNDDNNADGNRAKSIIVKLYADGVETEKTLELNSENAWTGTFAKLEQLNADGAEIKYTVKEVGTPTGYISSITGSQTSGYTITNDLETISIPVTKVWDDNNNQDGKRPTSIIATLYVNEISTGKSVTLNSSNNWTYTFTGLSKYKNGKIATYTIKEDVVTGYTETITGNQTDGYTITNTHEPEKVEIKVNKVWDDKDDLDGLRPNSITVTLYADDVATDKTAILDENNK